MAENGALFGPLQQEANYQTFGVSSTRDGLCPKERQRDERTSFALVRTSFRSESFFSQSQSCAKAEWGNKVQERPPTYTVLTVCLQNSWYHLERTLSEGQESRQHMD